MITPMRLGLIAAVFMALASCSNDTNDAPPLKPTTAAWISGVELTAIGVGEEPIVLPVPVTASFNSGEPPPESQGPPVAWATIHTQAGAGKNLFYDVNTYAQQNLKEFYVWVADATGYWVISLPEPVGSAIYGVGLKVTLKFSAKAPLGSMHIRTAGTDTLGHTGATSDQRLEVITPDTVTTPDVSAVLSWKGGSDLDIHVVDPFGHDLSVFVPTTPEGGILKGDGAGKCTPDTSVHETALWPRSTAPAGKYSVYVVYYADCGEPATVPFTVALKTRGNDDQELTGSFDGVAAGAAPDTVGTFTIK